MRPVLLDTHVWAWSLADEALLSAAALGSMTEAEAVFVSAISLYEIGQKVRLGKWPEMTPLLGQLVEFGQRQGVRFLPLSPEAALAAATLDWPHRDPFDRIIAGSALTRGLALISADMAFDGLAETAGWQGRIW